MYGFVLKSFVCLPPCANSRLSDVVSPNRTKDILVAEADRMTIVSLQPWTLPQARLPRHPIFRSVEGILSRAFPLPEDEPDGQLCNALALLVAALGRDAADAERFRNAVAA